MFNLMNDSTYQHSVWCIWKLHKLEENESEEKNARMTRFNTNFKNLINEKVSTFFFIHLILKIQPRVPSSIPPQTHKIYRPLKLLHKKKFKKLLSSEKRVQIYVYFIQEFTSCYLATHLEFLMRREKVKIGCVLNSSKIWGRRRSASGIQDRWKFWVSYRNNKLQLSH